jgi:hypothetical protein
MEGDSESEGPERGAEDELRCEISLEAEDNCNSSFGLDIDTSFSTAMPDESFATASTAEATIGPPELKRQRIAVPPKCFTPREYRGRRPIGQSTWYTWFLNPVAREDILLNPTRMAAKEFKAAFRVSYARFEFLVDMAMTWYDIFRRDARGIPCSSVHLLVLGVLHRLAHAYPASQLSMLSNISTEVHRRFFLEFVKEMWGQKDTWISIPGNEGDYNDVEGDYNSVGFPGCVGSIDAVHIGWNRCPEALAPFFTGKEGFPTVSFQVVANQRTCVQHVSIVHPGARNDKTTIKNDPCAKKLNKGSGFLNHMCFCCETQTGTAIRFKGAYFICDGGYLRWKMLVAPPPLAKQLEKDVLSKFARNVAVVRKDVECLFGRLKKRWTWLKHWNDMNEMASIEHAFVTCCILHNMILSDNGRLDYSQNHVSKDGEMENVQRQFVGEGSWMGPVNEALAELPLNLSPDEAEWWKRIEALAEHQNVRRHRNQAT